MFRKMLYTIACCCRLLVKGFLFYKLPLKRSHFKQTIISLADTHAREKKLLVEEIVQLKKQNEMTQREIVQKEDQIFNGRKELDRGSTSLTSAEQQIRILNAKVNTQGTAPSRGGSKNGK